MRRGTTGTQLAEAVVELLNSAARFTRENLEETNIRRRRESLVDREARVAADSRNGFASGVVTGMVGMALAGFTRGRLSFASRFQPLPKATRSIEEAYAHRIPTHELRQIVEECSAKGIAAHDRVMDRCGSGQRFHSTASCLSPIRMRC